MKLSKSLLVLSVLLMAFAIMLAACNKQESVKTEAKSSLAAPAQANTPAGKAAVKKECPVKAEKKVCHKKAEKKTCPMMAEKKGAADANAVKVRHMESRKHCGAHKMEHHRAVADANAAAKPCEKMMCALGDGKAANKNICSEHKGKKYCFCCEGCKKQFEKDPVKYTGKSK